MPSRPGDKKWIVLKRKSADNAATKAPTKDANDEDGKPVPPSTPASRKLEIDVDAIYARWNKKKAGCPVISDD